MHASWKLGDRVKIRHYRGNPGRIVELRGPLGPGGAHIVSRPAAEEAEGRLHRSARRPVGTRPGFQQDSAHQAGPFPLRY